MIKKGELISLMKGYYLPESKFKSNTNFKYQIANTIYGPSYIGSYSALSYYGLISESTQRVTSSCFKKSKTIINKVGIFEYNFIPEYVFPIGIKSDFSTENSFLIAHPEKALCEIIWLEKKVKISNYEDFIYFLEEDLRFDLNYFKEANEQIFEECIQYGKKKRILRYFLKCINFIKNVE